MATSKITKSCCNLSYDLLTILISFADVTTDIIVLIDFYQKDRMIFFGISLAILILAQFAYSIAFGIDFEILVEDSDWKWYYKLMAFFCMLPFGVFVPCAIFMNQNAYCPQSLYDTFGFKNGAWFTSVYDDGDLSKWIKVKLNRHLGTDKLFI